jgi:predicted enzyme related to lactoylglutathione lyase
MGPMTTDGVGRLAIVADPQGAVFSIFKAETSTASGQG